MWWRSRVEYKIDILLRLLYRWRQRDMAVWADIVGKVDELKRAWKKVSEDLAAVHAKLDECMKQDHLDQEALEAVKGDLAAVVGDMEAAHHSDGM